jgi:hypothetical protein
MAQFSLILNELGLGGLRANRFELPESRLGIGDSGEYQPNTPVLPIAVAQSYLGTPIIDQLQLSNADYSITMDSVLINVSMSKNIVTTAINGRNGTVKEYVSDGDYNISITGGIFSISNQYPETAVKILLQLLGSPEPLSVSSKFLQMFGIYKIAIQNYNLPQPQGLTNAQAFEISGLSDEPIELLINV